LNAEYPDWRGLVRRHWHVIAMFALGGILAFAGAVYVFLWFVSNAQSSGMVPSMLGLWTMANLVTFIVYAVLWELLLIGVPIAIAAVIGWRWWKRIPREEWRGYRFSGRKRTSGGGGGSLLFFVAFCIKVFVDGKRNVPIATFTLDYVVGSIITILVLGLIIVGIPVTIGLAWWLSREPKKP